MGRGEDILLETKWAPPAMRTHVLVKARVLCRKDNVVTERHIRAALVRVKAPACQRGRGGVNGQPENCPTPTPSARTAIAIRLDIVAQVVYNERPRGTPEVVDAAAVAEL